MKKALQLFAALLVAAVFIGTFVFLYLGSRPKEKRYETLETSRQDIVRTTVVTGKIEPRDEVAVKPQISGIITELLKEAGQRVEAGEVIAKLKVIPDMQQLSSAESRVRLATINRDQTARDHERQKTLYDKGLISANEYEKARQAYDQAREELAAAQDNLEVVRDGASRSNASASNTLVRSTISGIILDIPVKVGNSVILSNTFNDGTTIATVADMGNLIFRGNIDETEVGRLHPGMNMDITIGAMQDVRFDAALEYISPKATEQGGANQFEIKAAVTIPTGNATDSNSTTLIRSGYSATAKIVLEEARNVLTIPEAAIHFSGDSTFVYVVKDGDNARNYEQRAVTTGLSDGINIQILSGLAADEKVRGNEILVEKQ
ncbi:MAG: efflux RND transporter periplasmic adaptor subunit [Bacteroidaceae bacterium]|nr:efflux RND transporter periplasmic adaptor subunit [Bacteroidaceae bacterium]